MLQRQGLNFRLRYFFAIVLALTIVLLCKTSSASAAPSFPPGFNSESVVKGLSSPTAIDWASDGRMFIATKDGQVKVFENGQLLPTDFIDLSAQVNSYWDHGLLGIAVHPSFPITPYVYLLFTYDPPELLTNPPYAVDGPDGGGERVSRLIRVSAFSTNTNIADSSSAVVLLGKNSTLANIGDPADKDGAGGATSCDTLRDGTPVEDCLPSDGPSHSIGTVAFGVDGSLYVSNGEGTPFLNPEPRAFRSQNVDSLSGKILRINPDTGLGYPDNPFYDGALNHNRSRVWSYGLRNPFRFAINPVTNEPFVGDVGWYAWEELNTGKGKNFGWPCYEGDNTGIARQGSYEYYTTTQAACAAMYAQGLGAVQAPLYAYDHSLGDTAIIAGTFYTGTTWPSNYQGALFIADYARNWIKYLTFDLAGNATVNDFATEISNGEGGPVQLRLGPDQNLYYISLRPVSDSVIRRIRYTPGGIAPPTVWISATPTSGNLPLTVTFSSAGTFDPVSTTLSFEWAFGDGITSTNPSPTHIYTSAGSYTYTAVLTVTNIQDASSRDSLDISIGNRPPTATIITPTDGMTYTVGSTIYFSGTGADIVGSVRPTNTLKWQVRLHHHDHIHYDFFSAVGAAGSFVTPDHGDDSWLELCLTATDNVGLQDTQCVRLYPITVVYTFDTQPSGLQLTYGDFVGTTPFTVPTTVNGRRSIIAPPRQGGMEFISWSDGGAASHVITVGSTPQAYLAVYRWLIRLPLILRNYSSHQTGRGMMK